MTKTKGHKTKKPLKASPANKDGGPAKPPKKKPVAEHTGFSIADIAFIDPNVLLPEIEKKLHLNLSSSHDPYRIHSGLLTLDLILDGGLRGGNWYTVFGPEQAGKSTLIQTLEANAIKSKIPIITHFDYEGSFTPAYMKNILLGAGINRKLSEIFGVQDSKTLKYVLPPRIWLYKENIGERFFDYVWHLEKNLPDKLYRYDRWWFVYDRTKPNQSKVKGRYDKKLFKETGKYWVEAEDGTPQAVIITDSYPQMLPADMDSEDTKRALALLARFFSAQIPRIKGKLATKRITVVGVNQLRKNPGARFGNPEYEPCGDSLKHNSDVRIRVFPRSVRGGSGKFQEEDAIDGGMDTYRYTNMRTEKNKLSAPYLESWSRIWIADSKGRARGFDKAYDTYDFMSMCGWVTRRGATLKIDMPGLPHVEMSWGDFKLAILGNKDDVRSVWADFDMKPINLHKKCYALLDSRQAMESYFENQRGAQNDEDEYDDEDILDDAGVVI